MQYDLARIRTRKEPGLREESNRTSTRVVSQFVEQAPGPRGSPHEPQEPADSAEERADPLETAKTERSRSTRALSQSGHSMRPFPLTNLSKRVSQSRHRYS